MDKLKRSLSRRGSSTSGPLECMADFIDDDGVLRRSSSVTKRMALRGEPVGILATPLQPLAPPFVVDEVTLDDTPTSAAPPPAPANVEQKLPREERMRRRTQFVSEIRDRKHSLLVAHNDNHQERIQIWHYALELDPSVETTAENTADLPSPKSNAFVDHDGNLRRKTTFTATPETASAGETRVANTTSTGDVSGGGSRGGSSDEPKADGEDVAASPAESPPPPSSGFFAKMFAPIPNVDTAEVGEIFETLASG